MANNKPGAHRVPRTGRGMLIALKNFEQTPEGRQALEIIRGKRNNPNR